MHWAAWTAEAIERPGKGSSYRQNTAHTKDSPYPQGSQSGGVSATFQDLVVQAFTEVVCAVGLWRIMGLFTLDLLYSK
jgi:hypothetical protein